MKGHQKMSLLARLQAMTSPSEKFEEVGDEEGVRAALDGPHKVGTARPSKTDSVPTFSVLCAPVLELADRRDLHSRALIRRPGSSPGWGTSHNGNPKDIIS